jgi:hypothetical protein
MRIWSDEVRRDFTGEMQFLTEWVIDVCDLIDTDATDIQREAVLINIANQARLLIRGMKSLRKA